MNDLRLGWKAKPACNVARITTGAALVLAIIGLQLLVFFNPDYSQY
jgi:hypothetical protein